MPEILTESFCERCGTRYTFQSTAPKVGRMARMKVLSRGLKNYVLSDDTSLDEAFADARSVDDRQQSVEQLDAFHKTFNFCMSCRQYTCANCWNDRDGKCLSCAPFLGQSATPAAFPGLNPVSGIAGAAANGNGHGLAPTIGQAAVEPDPSAWPDTDVPSDASDATVSRLEALFGHEASARRRAPTEPEVPVESAVSEPEALGPVEAQAVDAADIAAAVEATEIAAAQAEIAQAMARAAFAPEVGPTAVEAVELAIEPTVLAAEPMAPIAPVDAAAEEATPAASPVPPTPAYADADEIAAAAAAQTHSFLDRFRARPVTPQGPASDEPVRPVAPTPAPIHSTVTPSTTVAPPAPAYEPMAAVGPTPVPAAPASMPSPSVPVPPAATPPPYVPPVAPAAYQPPPPVASPAPAWRMVAPETPVAPAPTNGHAVPSSQPIGPEPQWPTVPAWPAPLPRSSRANRADVLWVESTRDVLSRPESGVQACLNCGLALSATARFCRRCGANQIRA